MFKKICFAIACTLLLAACEDKRVVWSPDATKAAVLGSDGLRFSDSGGKLTQPLLKETARFTWCPDSKQCVLVRAVPVKDWTEIEPMLSKEESERIRNQAEKLFTEISEFKGSEDELNKKLENDEIIDKTWKAESVAYLDYTHGPELAKKIPDWNNLPKAQSYIFMLEKYNAQGDALTDPVLLKKTLNSIENVSVSPAGNGISYVVDNNTGKLFVVSPDGKNTRLVSSDCNKYPSWSADGKSLYFIEADGETKNNFRMGSINSVDIDSEKLDNSRHYQATVSFDQSDVIQVLPDKSIIFSNRKTVFPNVDNVSNSEIFIKRKGKNDVEQLTDGTLQKLDVQSFSVSPNGSKVALCSKSGAVHILTVVDKKVQTILPDQKAAGMKFTPNWRSESQICLAVKSEKPNSKNSDGELALLNLKDKSIKILSSDWPISCTSDFLVEKAKN